MDRELVGRKDGDPKREEISHQKLLPSSLNKSPRFLLIDQGTKKEKLLGNKCEGRVVKRGY